MQCLEERVGAVRALLEQCALGGPTPKWTCLSGVLEGLPDLNNFRCPGVSSTHKHESSTGFDAAGNFLTRRLQTYPAGMCEQIAKCIIKTIQRMDREQSGPGGSIFASSPLKKVSCWSSSQPLPTGHVATLLNETVVEGKHVILTPSQLALYLHVDDGLVISDADQKQATSAADTWMNILADGLEKEGFLVADRTPNHELTKVVGYQPVHRPAKFLLPADRSAFLYAEFMSLYKAEKVDIDHLWSLVGVWVWGALLNRDLLAIPQHIFKFIEKNQGRKVEWWPGARQEAYVMAAGVMCMECDIGAPLASVLFASDAQGAGEGDYGGFGIVCARVSADLALKTLACGHTPGRTVASVKGELRPLKYPSRSLTRTVPFTKLPSQLFDDNSVTWEPLDWGRWSFADHITLGEMRTAVRVSSLIAREPSSHRKKFISLQDNLPVQGSWMKGRSPSGPLNYLLRKRSANTLATGTKLILPWTESHLMPADDLSRSLPAALGTR